MPFALRVRKIAAFVVVQREAKLALVLAEMVLHKIGVLAIHAAVNPPTSPNRRSPLASACLGEVNCLHRQRHESFFAHAVSILSGGVARACLVAHAVLKVHGAGDDRATKNKASYWTAVVGRKLVHTRSHVI